MTIVVTGATGHLGRLIVEALLRNGTPASDVVAAGRNTDNLADLESEGVGVAKIDFNDAASLDAAFAGAETLMLVSASDPGQRFAQHKAAIDAAVRAGVARIVYTSATNALESTLILAPDHKATEEYLATAGVPFTVLRNNWYHENYDGTVAQARATGTIVTSTGEGRVASASRADYADAAAVVLVDDSHNGKVYELSGDTAWDFAEFAAAASAAFGVDVTFESVTPESHTEILTGVGLDAGTAGFVVALDGNIRDGVLGTPTNDLSTLIGRPTTTLAQYLAAAG